MTPAAIVSKLWNYCNVLRDDGMNAYVVKHNPNMGADEKRKLKRRWGKVYNVGLCLFDERC